MDKTLWKRCIFASVSYKKLYTIFEQPYNQEQKLLRQPHKCPPQPQFNVVWMTEKRKFNPLFPTLIMGAGGGRRTLKWPKTWKVSLFLHAIVWDGDVWGLAVQNLKFCQTLAIKLTKIDIFQSINRKFFVPQNITIPQGGCAGDRARIKKLF